MPKSWLVAVLVVASSCGLFFRAPTPIPATIHPSATGPGHALLVLLPGRGDSASSFAREGIVEQAQRRVPGLEVDAVDARLGYYIHRNLTQRLLEDVFPQARARGYRTAWISGISMGGLGALLFAQLHPNEVTQVIAVAPFLGDDAVIDEIERAGGLAGWQPPVKLASDDYQRGLWRWLKGCTEKRETCPRILLGFGADDRFVRAQRLLAAALPPEQVAVVPGGHDWGPWRQLYGILLDKAAASAAR